MGFLGMTTGWRVLRFGATRVAWRPSAQRLYSASKDSAVTTGGSTLSKSTTISPLPEKRRCVRWTEHERQLVSTLYKEGKSNKAISERLPHRSYRAVTRVVDCMIREARGTWEPQEFEPYPRQNWTAKEVAHVQQWGTQGKSIRDISRLLDRSYEAVARKYRRVVGGPSTARGYTPEEDRNIIRMRNAGLAVGQIAAKLGRSQHGIKNRWTTIRPHTMKDTTKPRRSVLPQFLLTLDDLYDIAEKLRTGLTWGAIRQSRWPDYTTKALRQKFHDNIQKRDDVSDLKDDPLLKTKEVRCLRLSQADYESVMKMRQGGQTIQAIVELKFPEFSESTLYRAIRRKEVERKKEKFMEDFDHEEKLPVAG